MGKLSRGDIWVLITAVFATAAKVYCAITTLGTEDVINYLRYGQIIDLAGMARALSYPTFNLTPLAAEYPAVLVAMLEGNLKWFPLLLKLPGILASLGSVIAMLWLQRRIPKIPTYAIMLFAASPVSFMIDGFHGNIDSVMIFPLLLAACACAAERPSWLVCAFFLALASQVKVVALLTSPVFAFYWFHRGRGLHFIAACGAAVILGWLPGLLASPLDFNRNVVGYGSIWGLWGITYFLRITGIEAFQMVHWIGLSDAQLRVSQILKLTIIVLVLMTAWKNRKGDASVLFTTIAFCWIAFFTLSPGMGMQYMVWFAPFVLVWNARWYTILTVVTSVTLFFFYQIGCGRLPWHHTESPRFMPYTAVLLVPWAAFLACTIALLWKQKLLVSGRLESEGHEADVHDSVARDVQRT